MDIPNKRLLPIISKKVYTEGSNHESQHQSHPPTSLVTPNKTNSLRDYLKEKQIQSKQARIVSISSKSQHNHHPGNEMKKQRFHPRSIQFSLALQRRKIGAERSQIQVPRKVSQAVISKKAVRNQQMGIKLEEKKIQSKVKDHHSEQQNYQKQKGLGKAQRFSANSVILSGTENYYINHIKDKLFTQQELTEFIYLLRQQNPLFSKISMIVAQSLLKIGCIVPYPPNDTIYEKDKPIRSLGLILWGQALLRKKNPQWKFNLFCGSSIGEQLLFQTVEYKESRSRSVEKGELLTFQKCKAVDNCGVLYIGVKEIAWMNEHLSLEGLKDQMLRLKSLLLRNYLKKREKRQQFG